MDLGTYIEHGGRPAVRFERTYPCEIERLWSAVTEPDELIHWFPSRAVIDLHVSGTVTFSGDPHTDDLTGTVLTCDPRDGWPSRGDTTSSTSNWKPWATGAVAWP